jgi:hypothetical protein
MAEYGVQINVKVGDHLININGSTPGEAFQRLEELAEHSAAIHAAIEKLDGRPATEVVQKPANAWGARGQGNYRGKAQTASPNSSPPSSGTPTEQVCSIHNTPLTRHAGGTNKAGKEYSASLRCSDANCKPQWLAGEK